MASSKKTLELDVLSVKSLNFKDRLNQNITSSFVLTANGNGTTSFRSVSSIVGNPYDTVSVPGQASVSSVQANTTLTLSSIYKDLTLSTNTSSIIFFNISTYPSITSTIAYSGVLNANNISTTDTVTTLINSGTAVFSSLQLNLSNFTRYINPNGSTRMFLDMYPFFQFPVVAAPSSISSFSAYPDGNNQYLKNYMPVSTNIQYYDNSNNIQTMSNIYQYMNITSMYPSTIKTNFRFLSNTFNEPMKLEINTPLLLTLSNQSIFLDHYVIDAICAKSFPPSGLDVTRSGFERSNVTILKPSLFLSINNVPSGF